MPTGINTIDRIVIAIGKHVIAEQALAGGDEGVGVDEPTDLGVVITGSGGNTDWSLGRGISCQAKIGRFETCKKETFSCSRRRLSPSGNAQFALVLKQYYHSGMYLLVRIN